LLVSSFADFIISKRNQDEKRLNNSNPQFRLKS
jgi:hypothetical protein